MMGEAKGPSDIARAFATYPSGSMNEEIAMNVIKSTLLATAIAMSFAATAGLAVAHETTMSNNDMSETMSHDRMMNKADAMKHDALVKHDMAMKESVAKDAMKSGGMDSKAGDTSMAAGSASGMNADSMEAKKDAMDAKQDRMDDKMDAKKDAMDAKMDATADRMEAKEEMLEDKAEMKEDKIDEMDSSQPVTDSWITTKVKSQLAATEDVRSLEITVNTVDGVVFLTGVVGDAAMSAKAAAAAKTIKGVKSVDSTGLKSM